MRQEKKLSIAVEMPPAMMTEARLYAVREGSTVEQFVFNCLKTEMARRRQGDDVYGYLMSQSGWLPSDYVFDREEANAR